MYARQKGFTLVEIAIVLVIIGLLLGGVLKGQELITQAKIKNVANDLNGMSAAVYGYQDRYKKFPGDDDKATTRWSTAANLTNGSGDGVIGKLGTASSFPGYESQSEADESRLFWRHLRLAGFIGGDNANGQQPQNAVGGLVGVQHGGLGLSGLIICSSNLPGKIANAIDAQFDDGDATKGSVRGQKQTGSNDAVAAGNTTTAPANAYVDDGATLYVVCKNL